jgi:hypothetical protein
VGGALLEISFSPGLTLPPRAKRVASQPNEPPRPHQVWSGRRPELGLNPAHLMDLGSERRGGEDEFQPPRGENRCREARVPTFFPLREFCLSFFPILVHVLHNSELEIFPAGPAMVSGEAAWVHPEPIALSTTDGTRRGTHVNVQPSHQARAAAPPHED